MTVPILGLGIFRIRLHVLDTGEDTRKRIVDLVGNTRRQGSNRSHFLGVGELGALDLFTITRRLEFIHHAIESVSQLAHFVARPCGGAN